ncbi:MAG: glutamyl-tRNA reductase [Cyanobacteria bacterium PR.3.49]|jgi:glutamyl-tRNA reductase|nr:glutamyl-tRNA reductase [Cyanobacteria bacterium PR.3.49]
MSHLVVCGLNYHSSPIAIRERFTIPQSCLKHALEALKRLPHVTEAVLLSTCNRTEVYAVVSDVQAGWREIDFFFSSTQQIGDHGALKPNFKLLREDVAVHLFRVAAGLDSMVLGEAQIMAQVKEAHQAALEAKTAGPILDHLFMLALNCGKRVRSETEMGKRAVSVSSAALELARSQMGSLNDFNVAVIGAGRMAQICAKLLLSENGEGTVSMLNRTAERVHEFAKNNLPNMHRLRMDQNFDERYEAVAKADLVIVSTSAHKPIIDFEELQQSRQNLGKKPACIIDISVPRNVDPRVQELEGVKLFDTDALTNIVTRNLEEREACIAGAEAIVFEALDAFHGWQRSQLVGPTIAELREKIESIRLEHMVKTTALKTASGQGSTEEIENISRAIVNQILHQPTVQLKATKDYEILRQQAEALRTLFSLDPLSCTHATRTQRRKRTPAGDS